MRHLLTSAQISSYRANGFLIVEDFLDKDELDTWRTAVGEAVSLRDDNRLPEGSFRTSEKADSESGISATAQPVAGS